MKGITVMELKAMLLGAEPLQLIDVREPDEHNGFNIGGMLIPLAEIGRQSASVATDRPVVLYCRKGIRSQFAIQKLEEKFPFTNLYNLIGGMEAWKKMEEEG
jgi:adenylyltransferase/sulfurtransferase